MFTRKDVPNYVEVTNLERREMIELKSIVELINWLDELFMLRREGEDGYGECVSVDARMTMLDRMERYQLNPGRQEMISATDTWRTQIEQDNTIGFYFLIVGNDLQQSFKEETGRENPSVICL